MRDIFQIITINGNNYSDMDEVNKDIVNNMIKFLSDINKSINGNLLIDHIKNSSISYFNIKNENIGNLTVAFDTNINDEDLIGALMEAYTTAVN